MVVAEPVEVARRRQSTNDERGRERDAVRRSRPPPTSRGGVADDGNGVDDGTGSDLTERDGVEELRVGHPVVVVDGVVLHQRDDDEAPAVRECTDLERDPHQREQAAGRTVGGRREQGPEVRAELGRVRRLMR